MRYFILFIGIVIAAFAAAAQARGETVQSARERADSAAIEIIKMRSSLAKEFIKPDTVVTAETFKQVCGAVGRRVKELKAEGLEVRHAAKRYRNPANAARPDEMSLMEKFSKEKGLASAERKMKREDGWWLSVTRPIYVEKACLACHGEKDARPDFIKMKYPDDRAWGFKEGDLRGIITVAAPID